MSEITTNLVAHIAELARLNLEPDEVERLGNDLNDIIDYIALLDELDLTDVEPTAHPYMNEMRLRPDRAEPFPNIDKIVNNGPDTINRAFRVPRIIEKED